MDKTPFYDISYGMYVVSTSLGGQKVGCIANTFCQITSEDMLISISLNKNNFTNSAIKNTKSFTVSVISENTNPEIIKIFGFYSSKDVDKFSEFKHDTVADLPVLKENTNGYFVCELTSVVDCRTHDVILTKVSDCVKLNSFAPMTYAYYHNVIKGKAPKNAPTFIEEKVEVTDSKKCRCLLCGYIYDDAKEKVKFEDLPDDWRCPLCGAPNSSFKEVTE